MFNPLNKMILTNQFGEETINAYQLGSDVFLFVGATAPVNGTTGDNYAGKGSLYLAIDTAAWYVNTGTITAPVWVLQSTGTNPLAALLTGYSSSAGTVAASDTILVGVNKLNGNQVLSKATADAALPSASFTSAAVTAKVLTGLASGANSTILSTDTILVALAKLQAQINALV